MLPNNTKPKNKNLFKRSFVAFNCLTKSKKKDLNTSLSKKEE